MISMEMLGKIRRMYFRDKLSLHQIAKRTGLSRNTIRKWVRAPEATQPAYQRCATFNKLSPFHETLEQALKADALTRGYQAVVAGGAAALGLALPRPLLDSVSLDRAATGESVGGLRLGAGSVPLVMA